MKLIIILSVTTILVAFIVWSIHYILTQVNKPVIKNDLSKEVEEVSTKRNVLKKVIEDEKNNINDLNNKLNN
jgi:chaperonin cofactor prefoldin